jgi:hypothetical protein
MSSQQQGDNKHPQQNLFLFLFSVVHLGKRKKGHTHEGKKCRHILGHYKRAQSRHKDRNRLIAK